MKSRNKVQKTSNIVLMTYVIDVRHVRNDKFVYQLKDNLSLHNYAKELAF